jgi:nucleoside-diphosphate-sugar epimerase
LDNAKARRLLGWTPKYDLAAGLRETVAWFSDSPDSPLRGKASATH